MQASDKVSDITAGDDELGTFFPWHQVDQEQNRQQHGPVEGLQGP